MVKKAKLVWVKTFDSSIKIFEEYVEGEEKECCSSMTCTNWRLKDIIVEEI